MESLKRLFLHQWQKKLVALLIACLIWFVVGQTITSTKIIPAVPIRIINLPVNKTVQGLLPNGFLAKRTTLTVTGTKDVVDRLEPGDIEILLDVSNLPDEWVAQISKKNLISLNPNVNLIHHITSISHPEILIKMHSLLTETIPITINKPKGNPPDGYDYVDIWPTHLLQTVTGSRDLVLKLKNKGLDLTFNLDDITVEELDALMHLRQGPYDNEANFPVPEQWKKIIIPLQIDFVETLNDPEAKNLQITFLKNDSIPIKGDLPLGVFYPLKYSQKINPETHKLTPNVFVQTVNHISVLKIPVFAKNVSKLFLDVIKDHLEITIVAAPKSERETLEWALDIVNYPHMEDTYVAFLLSSFKTSETMKSRLLREEYFRMRFRHYMQLFSLYLPNGQPFTLMGTLEEASIDVQMPNINPLTIKGPKIPKEQPTDAR
jgi:hypothetical protein